ncbi:hypothetical protein BH11BAC2_BH11BAC2_10370 [soil metagenome]
MRIVFYLFLLLLSVNCSKVHGQFTDRYWCFGDSAGIDFSNLSNPVPGHSILRVRGTCASICDSVGNLLFYAGSPDSLSWLTSGNDDYGYVINKSHQKMQNGERLKSLLWYQEMIIVPDPGNSERFYLFTIGVVSMPAGIFYSVIDLSYNNGLGKVTQKNIQLQSFEVGDGLAAVKHGNGRDWWVFMKPYSNTAALDAFYSYLISPSGVSGPFIQHIGSPVQYGSILRLKFTSNGSKLYAMSAGNLFESYDFDRCTGLLSNTNTIHISNVTPPYKKYWSFALSPDASKLYATSIELGANKETSFLTQYDLNASNVLASADTLQIFSRPTEAGLLQIGPDNKIYLSCVDYSPDCAWNYFYCDTSWSTTNSNISVINSPDSLGAACNFQPFSFNLGGHRTYVGLPNNPNYELAKDSGSICDTLSVGLNELISNYSNLFVYYDAQWKIAFINADKLTGSKYELKIYDISGREIIQESGNLDSGADGYRSFTRDMDMSGYTSGLYIISLTTEKEKLVRKFVKP